jgi:hypothetical protein
MSDVAPSPFAFPSSTTSTSTPSPFAIPAAKGAVSKGNATDARFAGATLAVVPEARKRRGAASKASTSTSIKGTGVDEVAAVNIDALILQLIDTNQRLKEKITALEAGEAEELLEEARIHTRSLEDLVLAKDEKIKALTEAFDANEVKAEQTGRRCQDLEAQLGQLKQEHATILSYQASHGYVRPSPSFQATNSASQPWTYRPTGHIKSMGGLRF